MIFLFSRGVVPGNRNNHIKYKFIMLQICTKKIVALVASVAIILSFLSCESRLEDKHVKLLNVSDDSELIQQKINIILKYNPQWTRNQIKVANQHIIVDGDILYPKDSTFYEYFPSTENNSSLAARHYRQQYLVSSGNIMVNVINIPSEWNDALIDAMNEWNSLGGGIYFYGQSSSSYHSGAINVHMGNFLNGFGDEIAGTYPVTSDGKPGRQLVISNQYSGNQLSYGEKKYTMVHELGHAIGLLHTDSASEAGNYNGSYIYTNLICDGKNRNSVMKKGVKTWTGFTYCDKKAYKKLYP